MQLEKEKDYMTQLMNFLSCSSISRDNDERLGCYIMTLGVIDECRQMGLGTLLLNQKCKEVLNCYPECRIIYLHVVDYNTSAIKFYTSKNDFVQCSVIKDHYEIFEQEYDAILLYKLINSPPSDEPWQMVEEADNEQ